MKQRVSEIVAFLSLLNIAFACEQWCRKPLSFDYVCCDVPSTTTANGLITSTTGHLPNITETSTKRAILYSRRIPIRALSCRYYCVYGEKVYCCDDGSRPLPPDHDSHSGRCPTKKETVCKKGGIYLHVHSAKVMTKAGGRMLSKRGRDDHHPSCASDGYCDEDEKCCENICAKKHTCMFALYDYDGATKIIPKKKIYKRRRQ